MHERASESPVLLRDIDTRNNKTCPICGTEMIPIGTELIRSEIVYTPPKLERIKYMATTFSCPGCKDMAE